eukprot:3936229-Amphidinium_carterae.1
MDYKYLGKKTGNNHNHNHERNQQTTRNNQQQQQHHQQQNKKNVSLMVYFVTKMGDCTSNGNQFL